MRKNFLIKKYLELAKQDNKRMLDILSKTTGKTLKKVSEDFERTVFMNTSQAVKYGIIDKVAPFNK